MIHHRQLTEYSCGAACFSIVTGIPEVQAIKLCKTNKSGTHLGDIHKALINKGMLSHLVNICLPIEECWFLANIKFPMILSGHYKTRYSKRGRPQERHHAVAIKDGVVYDPGLGQTFPIEAYFHTFDSLVIKSMIIVENT